MEEGEFSKYDEPSEATLSDGSLETDGDEGKWVLFGMAMMMSWCFFAVATAVGYYSWREDRLLLKYQSEGVIIPGHVSNIVLLREGSRDNMLVKKKAKALKTITEEKSDQDTASLSGSDEKLESVRSDVPYSESSTYLVAVKYEVESSPGYTTGVIKWIRLQGDVLPRSLFYRKKSSLVGMTVLFNLLQTPTQQETPRTDPDADTSLPLILIRAFPLSAHPQSSIFKARSLSSRSVTISIVSFFTIAGALAHCLAVHVANATNLEDGLSSAQIFSSSALISLLCVMVLFVYISVCILHKPIELMLEKEYTKRGEYSAVGSGQTNDITIDTVEMACRTFSSRSDVFLSMGNRALLQNASSC